MRSRRLPLSTVHPDRRRVTGDAQPEACVSIAGVFATEHHDEIIDLVRRFEQQEGVAHPGKRIVSVRADGSHLLINTNDARLARSIGEILRSTFQGNLKFHFGETDRLLRVHWER
ncbi:hypothetical protein [Noviherbaspirillum sp. ST9]|uniref:hypothetical protein n=1 Tax=Noviherbaspirillum sp. ST9 TaxID=3401606 RepID=UPI003B588B86